MMLNVLQLPVIKIDLTL